MIDDNPIRTHGDCAPQGSSNHAVTTHTMRRSERSPLHDVRQPAQPRQSFLTETGGEYVKFTERAKKPDWWSQTGSNRRPPACKAGALPTELWPQGRKERASVALQAPNAETLVGLGRLELPTSRLSSARSNQLSYKPLIPKEPAANQPSRALRAQAP